MGMNYEQAKTEADRIGGQVKWSQDKGWEPITKEQARAPEYVDAPGGAPAAPRTGTPEFHDLPQLQKAEILLAQDRAEAAKAEAEKAAREAAKSPVYQVFDYDTNKFVEVDKAEYVKREQFYRDAPEVGPPGTPGKITPVEFEKRFQAEHIKLPDNKYVRVRDWNELPESYQAEGLRSGFDAMSAKIETDKREALAAEQARQKTITALETYKTGEGGYNLALALKGGVKSADLEAAGFKKADIEASQKAARAAQETNVALADERTWRDIKTGKQYTDDERAKLIKATPALRDRLVLSSASGRRLGIEVLSFGFMPARALLPEVEVSDIKPGEWAVGGAQLALLATGIGRLPALVARGVQGAATGIFIKDTVERRNDMSPPELAFAVAIDTILVASLAGSAGRAAARNLAKRAVNLAGKVADSAKIPRFEVATPRNINYAFQTKDVRLLSEGGQIGAGYRGWTDKQFVDAVIKGGKPASIIGGANKKELVTLLEYARANKLKVRYGYSVDEVKNFYVYQNTATGRLAADRLTKARLIDRSSIDGQIRFHIETGKALGYRPQDIRAFLNNAAKTDKGFQEALRDLSHAIRTENTVMLKAAKGRLQIEAGKLPKELQAIVTKRLAALGDDVSQVNALMKGISQKRIARSLEANKGFIDSAEGALKRVKDPKRKEAIEQALKEARRQVKVATKVETKPMRTAQVVEEGRYPIAKTAKGTVPAKLEPAVKVKGKTIPVRVLAAEPVKRVAAFYRVPETELVSAVSNLPLDERLAVASVNPDIATRILPKEAPDIKVKVQPGTKPLTEPVPETKPETQPQPQAKPLPEAKPFPETRPTVETKPMTQPQPEVKPQPQAKPVPEPRPYPEPRPMPAVQPVTQTKQTPKLKPAPRIPPLRGKDNGRPTPAQLKTAEAWPQGFGWWVVYADKSGKPYRYFSYGQKPPRGVKYVTQGPGEAYRGIQQHRGKVPVSYKVPMGVTSVEIDKPDRTPGREGAIRFSRRATPISKSRGRLPGRGNSNITQRRRKIRR